MATTPFTLSGNLSYPPDTGEPNANRPFSGSGSFSSNVENVLQLVGAGTYVVGMGTVPAAGAKGLLVEVDPATTAVPIQVQYNTGTAAGAVEVSPGGFFAYFNPNPVAGITAISIVYTADVGVRVRVLG